MQIDINTLFAQIGKLSVQLEIIQSQLMQAHQKLVEYEKKDKDKNNAAEGTEEPK